jgi:hypothetical protein
VIVFGLRAGWSIKEMMSHEDIKKSTVYDGLKRKIGELLATGVSADVFMTGFRIRIDLMRIRIRIRIQHFF